MARIAYAESDDLDPEVASLLERVRETLDSRSGVEMQDVQVPNIFRAFARSPQLGEALWNLLGAVWNGMHLDRSLQELVILRVAQVRRSDYEWGRHLRVARAIGVPDEKLAALERSSDAPELTPAERAAVGLADALARDGDAPQDVIDVVLEHFDERQLVELTLLTGMYVMVATFLVGLRIDQEPDDPRLPAGAGSPSG